MRVAFVIPFLQKASGWRTHSYGLIQALRKHIEPVLVVSEEDSLQARTLFAGLPVVSVPTTQRASLQSVAGWRRLTACYTAVHRLDLGKIDLVHSLEAYPTGLVGSWLAMHYGCPHVITTHGTYGVVWHAYRLDRRAYAGVLRRTSLVCPVSQGTMQIMQQYFGEALAGVRIQPILNGNDFYKGISADEVKQRVVPGKSVVLSVGDIKPRKGQLISLAAFARVKAMLPEAEYHLAGHFDLENPYYRQLRSLIADQQLEGVTFLGAISDGELRRQYQQAAVFVLTPQAEGLNFEGFGLVYLEAGAYGVPVVAVRTGGVADAVRDRETGFLLEPEDIPGIAQAMMTLLTDPELNRQMGLANRQWAEKLTWERSAQEQFEAYREVLAGGRRAAQ